MITTTLVEALQELDEVAAYPDNWDEDGAKSFSKELISVARRLLETIITEGSCPLVVVSGLGSWISLSWHGIVVCLVGEDGFRVIPLEKGIQSFDKDKNCIADVINEIQKLIGPRGMRSS